MSRRYVPWMGAGLLLLALAAVLIYGPRRGGEGKEAASEGSEMVAPSEGEAEATRQPEAIETEPFKEATAKETPSEPKASPKAPSRGGLLVSKKTPEAGLLHGSWKKGDGSAAEGQRLRLHRVGDLGMADAQMVVATKKDGTFEAWVEAGSWRAVFDGDEYAVEMPVRGEHRIDHRDLPDTAASLRVQVSGPDLQPWNALITVKVAADGLYQVRRLRTGTDGVAVFERVRPGKAEVHGQIQRTRGGRPILSHALVEILESGVTKVVLKQPAGRLDVTVNDASTGAPVAGASVDFRSVGVPRPSAEGVTAESGRCRVDGLAAGEGTLSVSHPEYAPGRLKVSVSEKGGEAQVMLHRGFAVPVEAKSYAGDPMMIILRGRALGESPPRVWEWRLNEEGQGVMDRLPYEDLSLELLSAGCEPITVRTSELRAAGSYKAIFNPSAVAAK